MGVRAGPSPAHEWLLGDGDGGYACGTAADLPTRRYHGLWIARQADGARRQMVVAGLDERIGEVSLLHAHWGGQPGPMPVPAQVGFAHRPMPAWTFRSAGASPRFAVERAVLLQRTGGGTGPGLLVRWRNLGDDPLRLVVRPLLGWCDVDHLLPARDGFDGAVAARGASWGFRPDATLPVLWLTVDGVAAFRSQPEWYRGFHYAVDAARGYDHLGDRWTPGLLELDLPPAGTAVAAFSLEQPCAEPTPAWQAAEARARAAHATVERAADPLRARLALGAEDFLYRAAGGRAGVLAGFPWFGEWGRDAFLALPGLTLARGDFAACAAVLSGALPFLRRGLLPNIYGRSPEDSHYGSCDAALWFALAVQRFAAAGGDPAVVRGEYVPALRGIADSYLAGTGLGLCVDPSGLLRAGGPDLNATWMDAQTAAGPVTPRHGFPVEIQALWYALLAFLAEHGEARFESARDRCGAEFVARFWLPAEGYLADRVHDGVPDATVRPNMVIAAALPRSPLTVAQRRSVVQKAAAELVTARGLRTLSPRDAAYRGRYEGGIDARDAAYHQGTAWPWLAGFHVEAALRGATKKQLPAVRRELRAWLDGFLPALDEAGLDHVSEVFDGEAPQRPGGTFAQAWNTGELLRALDLIDSKATP